MPRPRLHFIIGCTACGKSSVGFELARTVGGEIVVIDSMKVYRGMNIGTAKPSPPQQAAVRYHLIDVVDPWEEFSVARYVELAQRAISEIQARGRPIVVVGGTALYINALSRGLFSGPGEDPAFRSRLRARRDEVGSEQLHRELRGIDPQAADRIHPNDYRRIERALEVHALTGRRISELQTQWDNPSERYDNRFFGLRRDKEDQSHRINIRVKRMIEDGLLEEVRALLGDPRGLSRQAAQAVGYAELIEHLAGHLPLGEAIENIKINSRRLAKAQRTWFKRYTDVQWIDVKPDESTAAVVGQLRPALVEQS